LTGHPGLIRGIDCQGIRNVLSIATECLTKQRYSRRTHLRDKDILAPQPRARFTVEVVGTRVARNPDVVLRVECDRCRPVDVAAVIETFGYRDTGVESEFNYEGVGSPEGEVARLFARHCLAGNHHTRRINRDRISPADVPEG